MVSMSANQASIRAEIFERLDAYLDKSRREVRPRAAHPPPGGSAPTGAGEFNSFTHDPTHPLTARRALPVHPPSIPRAQGTLKSNELYELVRLTTAFGVDGLPDGAHSLDSTIQSNTMPPRE